MTDLWQLIQGEYAQLVLVLSRVLSNRDAEMRVSHAVADIIFPWSGILDVYRVEPTFPKNIVSLALASDFLSTMIGAIVADHEVEEDELYTAFTLAKPLSQIYVSIDRYRHYDRMDLQRARGFLQDFWLDSGWFGGAATCSTRFLGAVLCTMVSRLQGDWETLNVYALAIQKILAGVFNGEPRTATEYAFVDSLANMFASLRGEAAGTSTDRSMQDTPSVGSPDAPYAAADDDRWYESLMEDSDGKSVDVMGVHESLTPERALEEAVADLESLIGLPGVKAEVNRLMAFLKIQQQRRQHGLRESGQTLHFVFTGNPGTGKTTVARIVSKILYGFRLLNSTKVVECDRSDLVGGYVGQTAIRTSDLIETALDGVLFIDEAYTLAGDSMTYGHGDMFGDEAINTLLKRMEDHRDRLVVIAAGYPKPMERFIHANPGLESRFTRYITFEDYTIADLCRIFEKFCRDAEYVLSTSSRAYASLLFTIAYNQRDERFGNARFIRNVFERATSLHSERLASLPAEQIRKETLVTFDAKDISFEWAKDVSVKDVDLSNARWAAECPGCNNLTKGTLHFLGQRVTCKKCNQSFTFPWWSLIPETVAGVPVELLRSTEDRRGVVERPPVVKPHPTATSALTTHTGNGDLPPAFDNWAANPAKGQALLQEGIRHLQRRECDAAIRCFEAALRVNWDGSDDYYLARAKAYELNGDARKTQAIEEHGAANQAMARGHYREAVRHLANSMKLDSEYVWAPNCLAWHYATCTEATARNGKEAVRYALIACHKSEWHYWNIIDTLAASYAELADFAKAIVCSERALLLAPPQAREELREKAALFRAGRPYRNI